MAAVIRCPCSAAAVIGALVGTGAVRAPAHLLTWQRAKRLLGGLPHRIGFFGYRGLSVREGRAPSPSASQAAMAPPSIAATLVYPARALGRATRLTPASDAGTVERLVRHGKTTAPQGMLRSLRLDTPDLRRELEHARWRSWC
jgi:hypothetical protein